MCRAVLPLLSSGLDVLRAAGQAGAGQGDTHGLWDGGWNLDTHCGAGTEQLNEATYRNRRLGLRSTGEGREGPVGSRVPTGQRAGTQHSPRHHGGSGRPPAQGRGDGDHHVWAPGLAPGTAPAMMLVPMDKSGSRTTPSPGTAVPRGWGETRGALWGGEVVRGAGQDGVMGPVSGRGCGTLDGSAESGAEGSSGVPAHRPPTARRRCLPSASSAPSRLCGGDGGGVRGLSPAR